MNRVEFEKRFIKSVNDYNEFDTIKYLFDKSMVAYELMIVQISLIQKLIVIVLI